MTPLKKLIIVSALLAGGSSLVMAQNGPATGGEPSVAGGAAGNPGFMTVQTPSGKTVKLRTMKVRGHMMILVPMSMACDVFHVTC